LTVCGRLGEGDPILEMEEPTEGVGDGDGEYERDGAVEVVEDVEARRA